MKPPISATRTRPSEVSRCSAAVKWTISQMNSISEAIEISTDSGGRITIATICRACAIAITNSIHATRTRASAKRPSPPCNRPEITITAARSTIDTTWTGMPSQGSARRAKTDGSPSGTLQSASFSPMTARTETSATAVQRASSDRFAPISVRATPWGSRKVCRIRVTACSMPRLAWRIRTA